MHVLQLDGTPRIRFKFIRSVDDGMRLDKGLVLMHSLAIRTGRPTVHSRLRNTFWHSNSPTWCWHSLHGGATSPIRRPWSRRWSHSDCHSTRPRSGSRQSNLDTTWQYWGLDNGQIMGPLCWFPCTLRHYSPVQDSPGHWTIRCRHDASTIYVTSDLQTDETSLPVSTCMAVIHGMQH